MFPSAYYPSGYFPAGYFPTGAPVTGGQYFPEYFAETAFPAEYFPGAPVVVPPLTTPPRGAVAGPRIFHPPTKRRPAIGRGWIVLDGFQARGVGAISAVGSDGSGVSRLGAEWLASGMGCADPAAMLALERWLRLGLSAHGQGQHGVPPPRPATRSVNRDDDEENELLEWWTRQ